MTPATLLFWLLVAHAVCDFPLQGDFLARAKNHRAPVRAATGQAFPWPVALAAHALIHAGAVAFLTGSVALGVAEFFAHVVIDYATSEGWNNYLGDQLAHLLCKLAWVALAAASLS